MSERAYLGSRGWLGIALLTAGVVVACGSSDEASSTPDGDGGAGGTATSEAGPGGGSAVCGINGTSQCRAGKQCDAVLGCVDCTADNQCPATAPFCIAGGCQACRTNADCGAAAPACFPGDHKCHAACTGNASCPPKRRSATRRTAHASGAT